MLNEKDSKDAGVRFVTWNVTWEREATWAKTDQVTVLPQGIEEIISLMMKKKKVARTESVAFSSPIWLTVLCRGSEESKEKGKDSK